VDHKPAEQVAAHGDDGVPGLDPGACTKAALSISPVVDWHAERLPK
jgi:hypothetical protein